MTTFTWIQDTDPAEWQGHRNNSVFLKMTVAELAERSGSQPDRVVRELRDWLLNMKHPAYTFAWSLPVESEALVVIAKALKSQAAK